MNSVRIQGVLAKVHGIGVLIRGAPASGKSLAALKLMDRGHKLVADDLLEVTSDRDGKLTGNAVEPDVRIEIRGLGLYSAKSVFASGVARSAQIDLAVELAPYEPGRDAGRISPEVTSLRILGVDLTCVHLPITAGSDAALLIELLARHLKDHKTVKPLWSEKL